MNVRLNRQRAANQATNRSTDGFFHPSIVCQVRLAKQVIFENNLTNHTPNFKWPCVGGRAESTKDGNTHGQGVKQNDTKLQKGRVPDKSGKSVFPITGTDEKCFRCRQRVGLECSDCCEGKPFGRSVGCLGRSMWPSLLVDLVCRHGRRERARGEDVEVEQNEPQEARREGNRLMVKSIGLIQSMNNRFR